MNKRIRKKYNHRFNVRLLGLSFFKLEQVLGHGINHKIKRALTNHRLREYRKEKRNTGVIDDIGNITNLFDEIWYGRGICSTNVLIGTEVDYI